MRTQKTRTDSSASKRKVITIVLSILALPPLCIATYVLSVVWRVSLAENKYFGRSELIPLVLPARKFQEPAVAGSFGQKTFRFAVNGKQFVVWRQKINGFQHMYGSALASYELGEELADRLFCMNELAEFVCDFNGVEPSDLLDRKKDLLNNAVGRKIGKQVMNNRIFGNDAEQAIAQLTFQAVENNPDFLAHFVDLRVMQATEEHLGCNCLPRRNLFNYLSGR